MSYRGDAGVRRLPAGDESSAGASALVRHVLPDVAHTRPRQSRILGACFSVTQFNLGINWFYLSYVITYLNTYLFFVLIICVTHFVLLLFLYIYIFIMPTYTSSAK